MTDTPKAEKLTAEEEARWRKNASCIVSGEWPGTEDDRAECERALMLFATLDASRAETEAVRRGADDLAQALNGALSSLSGLALQGAEAALLRYSRARAQGIGGEKEKAGG